MAKTKEQSIKRELIAGGTLMTLSMPLVLFVLFGVFMSIIIGAAFLSGDATREFGLSMLAVYGSLMLIFGWLFWRIGKRVRLLFHRRTLLQQENERVADMLDTSAAATRLQDRDGISQTSDIEEHQHVQTTLIAKHEQT